MIVDTDLLIDYLQGWKPGRNRLEELSKAGRLQTTAINQFELLSGAKQPETEKVVRQLLEAIDIIPLDPEAAQIGARIRQNLLAAGSDIGMADSLVAGIALARNIPVITRNRKHFERVPSLKLMDLEHDR